MPDLNSFLETHRSEHVHICKPVALEHIGALTAQSTETIVFEDIQGYPGFQLVDLLFNTRRAQARVLGCAPREVVKSLAEVLKRGPKALKEVDGGPCQERIFLGEDVDLSRLPIVTHTDRDPYPYSTSFAVHRDPETCSYNQMFPRCGVLSRNEMVSSFVTATANRILARHRAAGTRMPQAIVIGAHPAWELAGTYTHPHEGWWEFELFETISGQVGEVTRCKTVDLVVPAEACIVIEGFIDPSRSAQDGPSPGPTMLYTPYAAPQPVFEVTAITMSRNPIYRNHLMTPFTDHQEMPRLFHEAIIYRQLLAMGLGTHDVYFPQGGGAQCCIIQVEPRHDGQVTDALLSVLGAPFLNMKMAIAVDPDIDIYDYRDVQYALSTRVDPGRDLILIPTARAWPFDPTGRPVLEAGPETAQTRFPSVGGKWAIDATKPVPYRSAERKNFERAWPKAWGQVKLEDYLD